MIGLHHIVLRLQQWLSFIRMGHGGRFCINFVQLDYNISVSNCDSDEGKEIIYEICMESSVADFEAQLTPIPS